MISNITRHGIVISNELPHTYMDEINKAVNAVRSRFTENFRKPKTREQRHADRDHALKVFGIFEFEMFDDIVMVYRRHMSAPMRVSPAYVFVIQRPPALRGVSGSLHQMVIESITETLPAEHYVYGVYKNPLVLFMKDKASRNHDEKDDE